MKRLDHYWYDDNAVARLLAPLSWLFCTLAMLRRTAYRCGWRRAERVGVPVVVVGNITVGGSGKTPVVVWLVDYLRRHGKRVGVVSRGYGGQAPHWPQPVDAASDPAMVGDEPVLIARRTGVPLAVGPDRVAAARFLLARHELDVIVSDDGLQHYRLARDVEVAVVDGRRGLGNGRCLPAGPLRERPSRLAHVDVVVTNGGDAPDAVRLEGALLVNLRDDRQQALSALGGSRVHGVAAIGDPRRFFATLAAAGLTVVEHAFPDHHPFRAEDLAFGDGLPVVMTEKDAVKCTGFASENHWYLPVEARVPEAVGRHILDLIER
ncbi:MAG: tetraacyldisaccharide 4'-kinase [Thiohalomonadaceae bacterium]